MSLWLFFLCFVKVGHARLRPFIVKEYNTKRPSDPSHNTSKGAGSKGAGSKGAGGL